METDLIMNLVGNLGAIGFILVLVWRTTNHTIPRLAKFFEDGLEKQRLDFKEITFQTREDFKEQIERERNLCQEQTNRLIEALKELKNEIRR